MKKFEEPKLNIEMMEAEDIIATSGGTGCTDDGCAEYSCPWVACPVD